MKYCVKHGLRYPDTRTKCRAGGCELVDAETVSADRIFTFDVATSCCPNSSCAVVVAHAGANFCEGCGSKLRPISSELWIDKLAKPALENNAIDLLLDPSNLFRAAAQMGLSGHEARKRLDDLLEERTGASAEVLDAWIQETMDLFQDGHEGDQWGSAQHKSLSRAKKLRIKFQFAMAVVEALAQRTGAPSENFELRPFSPDSHSNATSRTTDQSGTWVDEAVIADNSAMPDPNSLRTSAISFYRNLVSGGHVSNNFTYLNEDKKTSVQALLTDQNVFLREVAHKQGTFVLFRSDNEGWVFPNPRLIFRRKAFTGLFPALTREQFNDSKHRIDPVRVIGFGRGRWRVSPAQNGQRPIKDTTETASVSATPANVNPVVAFPISAADYLRKLQGSAKVVRHQIVRGILVSGPDGRGEFALIDRSDLSNNVQSLVVIPRIASFRSADTFHNLYEKYYDCPKPSAGYVWIIDAAVVSKVEGGWELREKGVLEVRDHLEKEQRTPPDAEQNPASPVIKSEPVAASDSSLSITKQRLILMGVIGTLFLAIVIFWLFHTSTVEPLANGNTNQLGPSGNVNPPPRSEGMAYIAGGVFLMGNDAGDDYEKPAHNVTVNPFYIDATEVTCEEYQKFIKETGHKLPQGWINGTYSSGSARKPVTGVDWYDADEYARWAKKRLPTEEEWEFAARGTDGRIYPWGNEWKKEAANADGTSHGRLSDVGRHKDGASPFGVFDMVGNAWEWTASELQAYPGSQLPSHLSGELKIIRGGSWKEGQNQATTTYRGYLPARGASDYSATGFRCAKSLPDSK